MCAQRLPSCFNCPQLRPSTGSAGLDQQNPAMPWVSHTAQVSMLRPPPPEVPPTLCGLVPHPVPGPMLALAWVLTHPAQGPTPLTKELGVPPSLWAGGWRGRVAAAGIPRLPLETMASWIGAYDGLMGEVGPGPRILMMVKQFTDSPCMSEPWPACRTCATGSRMLLWGEALGAYA